jgi:RNA recognition motif-containing protein
MPVRLFVGNLPYNVTEAELREHFSAIGTPSYIYLPVDRETGKLRGFAFVEFTDSAQAEEAIRRLNNQSFKGRPLSINEARAREDRPRTGAPPRPFAPRPGPAARPNVGDVSARAPEPGQNFGPDKAPRRKQNKSKGGAKSERAPKGPMREVVRGRFFGGDEDDTLDDLDGENFASREDDSESDDSTYKSDDDTYKDDNV